MMMEISIELSSKKLVIPAGLVFVKSTSVKISDSESPACEVQAD